MKNKKYLLVVSLIVILTVVTFLYFFGKKEKEKSGILENTKTEVVCNFMSDEHALDEAIQNGKAENCLCLKDDKKIEKCIKDVVDVSIYKQAIKYLDPEYCDGITSSDIKTNCQTVVASGLNYVKKYEK
jgi:hypothetical protein